MSRVIIGMDPHKRSATIEVMAGEKAVLGGGRYATDVAGYRAMLAGVKAWPERVWAIEGCQGIGRHLANRLLADGEQVVDVPAKLSARTRVFTSGQGRKTDATDAHSVALAATRMTGLRLVVSDVVAALADNPSAPIFNPAAPQPRTAERAGRPQPAHRCAARQPQQTRRISMAPAHVLHLSCTHGHWPAV